MNSFAMTKPTKPQSKHDHYDNPYHNQSLSRVKKRQKIDVAAQQNSTAVVMKSPVSTSCTLPLESIATGSSSDNESQPTTESISTVTRTSSKTVNSKESTSPHITVVPKSLVRPTSITQQVRQASRLVAQHLHILPERSPGLHLQAATIIENFGIQVFLPYIMSEAQHYRFEPAQGSRQDEGASDEQEPTITDAIRSNRIFYATLLALREVLAQNASRFFQFPDMTTPSTSVASDSKTPTEVENNCEDDDHEGSDQNKEEESVFCKLLFATAVVLAACQAGGKDEQVLLQHLQTAENFPVDRLTPLVSFHKRRLHRHMQHPHAESHHVETTEEQQLQSWQQIPKQASVAYRVGFNLALAKKRAANSASNHQQQTRISLPEPTTCWVTVVEDIPLSAQGKSGDV